MIEPWAHSVSAYMLADVARRDAKQWKQMSADISAGLRQELENAPVADVMNALQQEQVRLITSIPLEAAERVQRIAEESVVAGARSNYLFSKLMETEAVTEARARLIARTEVSRAAANLVEARASYAGSDGYIWRTVRDANVRESHKEMEGRYVRWSEPPTLDNLTGHAGTMPNCRCFAEPVFRDD